MVPADQHQNDLHLTRIDCREIDADADEIRLFVCARNEALRLPYFLDYYFSLGVDRVFLIDNDSQDDTAEIALSYDAVHVFQTAQPYRNYMLWMEQILDRFATDRWCCVADVDELFFYPAADVCSLPALCQYLEQHSYNAVRAVLLDMYSSEPLSSLNHQSGDNPFRTCSYFDRDYRSRIVTKTNSRTQRPIQGEVFIGGMRERVFNHRPWISKIPLLRWSRQMFAHKGMHWIDPAELADIQSVMFHFKYFQDFVMRVPDEVERSEHNQQAIDYQKYNEKLLATPDLSLHGESSIRLIDENQLLNLALLQRSDRYLQWVGSASNRKF